VVDGDARTSWTGVPSGGSWLTLTYDSPELYQLNVQFGDTSPTNMKALASTNAVEWQDLDVALTSGAKVVRYVWLIFPDMGNAATTTVREVQALSVPKSP
jgi:hypothetical protein